MHHMTTEANESERFQRETGLMNRFLDTQDEASFASVFASFTPRLVAFFRARGCGVVAEDLAQEVMLTVYRKAGQVRVRALFRAWVFRIARNTLSRHFGRQSRGVDTVDLADIPECLVAANGGNGGTPTFEFTDWMGFLEPREKEALTLRFVEEWEYHEIAAAQKIPIGTVQWRVFNAKKKLAPVLRRVEKSGRREEYGYRKAS
jgi:RNA polymerase sigma-70 factor (ECF subfamily)